ncbi:MAG: hypothetical protein WCY77_10075 [Weeksellaceae bacterium]
MSVKDRLKEFVRSMNLTIRDFEISINASNGYVNSISKGIGADKLEMILEKYPNLNTEWLLTGVGNPLKEDVSESEYMKEVTSRFFEVFEHLKKTKQIKTQDDLAKILKTNKQAISDLKAHRKKLSIENLFDLKKSYESISLDFIILGKGSIEVDSFTTSEKDSHLMKLQKARIEEMEQANMLLKKELELKSHSNYKQAAEPSQKLKKK